MSWPPVMLRFYHLIIPPYYYISPTFDQGGRYRMQYQFWPPTRTKYFRRNRGVWSFCGYTWRFRLPFSTAPAWPPFEPDPSFHIPLPSPGTMFWIRFQQEVGFPGPWLWVTRSPVFTILIPT